QGTGMGAGVGHEAAFLAGNGVDPGGVKLTQACLTDDGFAVGQGEADLQVIPVLSLADAADGGEIPVHLPGQCGLSDQFFAAEQALGVVPLAPGIQIVATGMKLPGANDPGGIGYPGCG